jgi:hypothetical protein
MAAAVSLRMAIIAATPLFALIYKKSCVKLRKFSRVPVGRMIVLQIGSIPTHE